MPSAPSRRIFAALLWAGLLAASAGARAQQARAGGAADAADTLIRTGYGRLAAGDAEGALGYFRQAHRIAPSPRTLAQMGMAEGALERWAGAEAHLSEALASEGDRWIERRRRTLEARLRTVREHLGRLELRGPSGVQIRVDHRHRGRLPLEPLWLTPGTHPVEAIRGERVYFEGGVSVRLGEAVVFRVPSSSGSEEAGESDEAEAGEEPPGPSLLEEPAFWGVVGAVAVVAVAATVIAVIAANPEPEAPIRGDFEPGVLRF